VKLWLVPSTGKLNKMSLMESEERPPGAIAEWPKGWSPLLAETVEVQIPPGKVKINMGLLMQMAKRYPVLYSKAKETGLEFDAPPKGFFKRIAWRFRRK